MLLIVYLDCFVSVSLGGGCGSDCLIDAMFYVCFCWFRFCFVVL